MLTYCLKLPFIALVFIAGSSFVAGESDAALTGELIVNKLLDYQSPESEVAFISMKIMKPGVPTKEYRLLYVYKNDSDRDRYLLRIIRPKPVQNVTVLANEMGDESFEQFVYLPGVGQTTRLKNGSGAQPFMNSDFTYDDLIQEIPSRQLYTRLQDSVVMEKPCFTVMAKDAVGEENRSYHHRRLYIEKGSFNLMQTEFFSDSDTIMKTLYTYNYDSPDMAGPTTRPQKALMSNHEVRTSTTFTVIEARLNEDIDTDLFTPEAIETWSDDAIEEFIFQMEFSLS